MVFVLSKLKEKEEPSHFLVLQEFWCTVIRYKYFHFILRTNIK